jgi:L-asparaginase
VLAADQLAGPIPIVTATVAMDPGILDAAAGLRPAGIVVAATGAGNTAPELLAEAERAMASGIPIVMVSRAPSGPAGTGYAFPGGGATWARAGAMLAGTLTAPKARIALAVGLGAGLGGQDLGRFLAGPDVARPQSPDVASAAAGPSAAASTGEAR